VTAILSPVTLADVERRALLGAGAHAAALAACDCLDEMGRRLEAAAGRAREGAKMAALVAEDKRLDASGYWDADEYDELGSNCR